MEFAADTAVIINRRSGYLAERSHSESLVALKGALREAGISRGLLLREPGEIEELLAAEREKGSPTVIVGGGDGTIAMAAQVLLGSETALGVLPMGTMNFLARDLDLPLDPVAAFSALRGSGAERVDIGRVNGQLFLCATILGFFPSAAARARDYHGRNPLVKALQTGWLLLSEFHRSRPMRLHFCIGDDHRAVRTRLLIIANNPFAQVTGLMPQKEGLHTGRLAIYVSRHAGLFSLLKGMLLFLLGKYHADRDTQIIETEAIEIHGSKSSRHLMIDGEHRKLDGPIKVELLSSQLRVLCPKHLHENRPPHP